MSISGKEFNKKYANTQFCKLMYKDEIHYGFQYVDGLNCDTRKFDATIEYGNGLYFTNDLRTWIDTGDFYWVRSVIIPDDAEVFEYGSNNRFKSDKLFLGEKKPINLEFYKSLDISISSDYKLVKKYPTSIRFIEDDNIEYLWIEACKKSGWLIKYSYKQTTDICLAALSHNGNNLQHIRGQTVPLCLYACHVSPSAIQYVEDKHVDMLVLSCMYL